LRFNLRLILFILSSVPKGSVAVDPELILAAQEGDREALEMLIKLNQEYVYRLVYRQVRNPSWAEDLTQDVFLRVFRSLHTLKESDKFPRWLSRIALNVCNSWFVSKQYRNYMVETVEDKHTVNQEDSNSVEQTLELKRLIGLIGELPSKYREVIVLCILESHSYVEAAELLEIPVGTVASRMHTALKTLRRTEGDR
jgi:RNA polymerase sigma-70 factor, ECF subfamily